MDRSVFMNEREAALLLALVKQTEEIVALRGDIAQLEEALGEIAKRLAHLKE